MEIDYWPECIKECSEEISVGKSKQHNKVTESVSLISEWKVEKVQVDMLFLWHKNELRHSKHSMRIEHLKIGLVIEKILDREVPSR